MRTPVRGVVFGLALMVAVLAVPASGCKGGALPPLPTNTPGDVIQAVDCVLAKVFAGDVVIADMATCVSGDVALATDLVEWLLRFTSVRAKLPPEQMQMLRVNIAAMHKQYGPSSFRPPEHLAGALAALEGK